ncbi:MAG: complex I subunit 5 family protein [Solirubrobacteraceae bacterium]
MTALPALAVAVPLVVAAALAAAHPVLSRLASDAVTLVTAAAVTALCAILVVRSAQHPIVAWMGGWQPRHGIAIGLSLTVDPLGAGLATFVSLTMVAAVVFSWRYLRTVDGVYHALMLVFLAAMVGFCLAGDLFNLFVFLELMSVSAYALTGLRTDRKAPLEGSLNFAITNSIGGFLVLMGIGLLYGRTGALNLAQIGQALSGHGADGLVVAAFTLLACGFFVKAAAVPFHFWLADTYAVAPTPVCVLLAAVQSELGLYAVARVYWTAFSGAVGPHEAELRAVLVGVGVLTALLGAVMCFAQTHLKRLLAFATISYIGLFLIGVALLSAEGLAGAAVFIVGDGLAKASLFVCVGILQHRRGGLDELALRGEGRGLPVTGTLFAFGGLALASVPPFGGFLGKSLIERAAGDAGYGWVVAVFVLASAVVSGAVLRAAGRIFLGIGPAGEPDSSFEPLDEERRDEEETGRESERTPAVLIGPAVALAVGALVVGMLPGMSHAALSAADRLQDRGAYAAAVLEGAASAPARVQARGPEASDYGLAALSTAAALAVAVLSLVGPESTRRRAIIAASRGVHRLRELHSGHAGDYVAWLALGTAVLGGLFALALR